MFLLQVQHSKLNYKMRYISIFMTMVLITAEKKILKKNDIIFKKAKNIKQKYDIIFKNIPTIYST